MEKDMEIGRSNKQKDIRVPLIGKEEILPSECQGRSNSNQESIMVVLLSTAFAVCGSFGFGSCVGYTSPTQLAIRKDLNLSVAEYSLFGSILTIGATIGAITSGQIADFIGRKGTMRLSAVFCSGGWLAIYFAKGVVLLDVGRLSTGYAIGVFSYVVPVFIAEIAPINLRGTLTTLNQLMICFGGSVSFLLGTVLTWRTLALTGVIPCLILFHGLFFVPESPRWLAKVGQQKEFEMALRKLRGKNADISSEAAEIQDYTESLQHLPKSTMLDLFQRRYLRSLIVGVGLMVFQQCGGINGIVFYASEIFTLAGFSSGNIGLIAIGCTQAPVTALGAILMDKSGRRPLLMISATGTFFGCLLTGFSFFLKGHEMLLKWVPIMALVGVLFYLSSFSLGVAAIPWVIMSEIFPVNVKGTAGSLVTMVNWIGSWVVSYTFNFLISWSSSGTFFLYSGVCAATVLFVAMMVPETKGRTLEEIQATMNTS